MRHFYALLVNLVATRALVRNLASLLHSTITKKSNKTIKPAIVFQNSMEKITNKTMCLLLHFIT